MAKISQLITDLVTSQILDSVSGFNYWVGQLCAGADYPNVPRFQLSGPDGDPPTLIQGAVDEAQIDDASLFTVYPACVIRSVRGDANAYRMTPTIYSGPVVAWVDMYSSVFKDDIQKGLSEQYHDLFLDAMTETFGRQDEFYLYQGGIAYNNDLAWSRGPLGSGGVDFRQKQRFILSFNIPMQTER